MIVTVLICTYNRAAALKRALECLAASEMPAPIEWEVLVVDNNSNDETRAVVESLEMRYPRRFRYLFEGTAGKSYALNSGVAAAAGEVVAFLDDDVTVDRDWLSALTMPLQGASEWSGSGGPVVLSWPQAQPRWLDSKIPYATAPLAGFTPADCGAELKEPPYGTNMAFRKSMFKRYGLFRTDLGPGPRTDVPRPNEDTEFGRRLLSGGERLRYVAEAVVHHPVPEERLRKKYFLKWWYDKGRADLRQFGNPAGAICARGVRLVFYRRALLWTLRWLLSWKPSARFNAKTKLWVVRGMIAESRYQFRQLANRDGKKAADKKGVQCATLM